MSQQTEEEIQSEFQRQAQQMASAPAFQDSQAMRRLVEAVGNSLSARVLDLACGPGIVAEAIAPHVRAVVGIDMTPRMIELARQRFREAHLENGQFAVAAAEDLPFDDASFEQVITRLSLHHLADATAVLAGARRLLRPAGRLIVADVISSDDPDEAMLHNSIEMLRDPTHVWMLPPDELLSAIKRAGFTITREQCWQQQRSFAEWAAIIADPRRTEPLENVMRALARAGLAAGISLDEEQGQLRFTHTWMLVEARVS